MAYKIKSKKITEEKNWFENKNLKDYFSEDKPEEIYNGETDSYDYIWKNKKDPTYTVEVRSFHDEELDANYWYVYPAKDGKGIPDSPDVYDSEEEAVSEAKKLLKEFK